MVLSNAERQRRHRERLKARAEGGNLVEQVSAAMWALLDVATKHADEGYSCDADGRTLDADEYVRLMFRDPKLVRANGQVPEQLREIAGSLLQGDLGPMDRRTVERAAAILDAVYMVSDRPTRD